MIFLKNTIRKKKEIKEERKKKHGSWMKSHLKTQLRRHKVMISAWQLKEGVSMKYEVSTTKRIEQSWWSLGLKKKKRSEVHVLASIAPNLSWSQSDDVKLGVFLWHQNAEASRWVQHHRWQSCLMGCWKEISLSSIRKVDQIHGFNERGLEKTN